MNTTSRMCRIAGLALCLSALWCAQAGASDADQRGQELARSVHDRPDGRDLTTVGTMTLTEAGREPRVRELITYRTDPGNGKVASLIRFLAPADIRDTGLLTIDRDGGETDQWIYLPALDRSRRIPATRKGGRFVGSDLFYEDLQDREVERDRHRWLRTEAVAGVEAEVVESTPLEADDSVYGRRVSWIHPDIFIPLRIDFFSRDSAEPFKRLTVQRVERIDGYWTVMDSVMEDLESGHSTRMTLSAALYDRDLPDDLFSVRVLEDPAREAPLRP